MENYLMSKEFVSNACLAHYGIPGMKWGVRRYQNADGTLTAAGKRRYVSSNSDRIVSPTSREFKKKLHSDLATDYVSESARLQGVSKVANSGANVARRKEQKKREKAMWKDASRMSDQELQRIINRMNLERNYNSLQYDKVNAGKIHASEVLSTIGDISAAAASLAIIASVTHRLKTGKL